jgi:hypothetical protein
VDNTVAETYLKKRRLTCALPQDLHFLSKGTPFTYQRKDKTLQHATLASFARNAQGVLQSVQLTSLSESGSRVQHIKAQSSQNYTMVPPKGLL